ncbi:rotatin homolog anastral spindle 3 isoform X2 [Rhynchophorus ferrugineus]|uniref:rotatin homolog anastral spindle 3 isoform X2 n=1 Tax=Rhynchophorus ferrugineus TaxID=354439 RepID=UPI003FCCDD97
MCEKYINVKYIEKLAHTIPEIRERALFYIVSKLDDGYKFNNDLAKSRAMLAHLFNWFLFEPCTHEMHVLNLIIKIIESDTGKLLVNHLGKSSIQLEIDKIKTYINPQYMSKLNEVQLTLLNVTDSSKHIPPLRCYFPLSHRSSQEDISPIVGSTATSIQGYVQQRSSLLQQIGQGQAEIGLEEHEEEGETYKIYIEEDELKNVSNIYVILKWQSLIETDRNVLQSVENSLRNSHNSSALFHSCEFFKNVLLHDFPAEIFLQRPGLVLIFYEYLQTCQSTQITNIILICLYQLTKELQKRISQNNIPCMQNTKIDNISNIIESNTGISSNRSENSTANSDYYIEESSQETEALQRNQIHIPYYCFQTMNIILKALMLKKQTLKECKLNINQPGINTALKLLTELHYLLCQSITDNLWKANPGLEHLKIFREFTNTFSIFGDTLDFFKIESLSSETNTTYRLTYLYLLSICSLWINKIKPSRSNILPKNFMTSISNSLLDVSIGCLFPSIHNCFLEYVLKYEAFSTTEEKDVLKKYEDVRQVCDGLTSTVLFQNNPGILTECIHLVEVALPSLLFHKSEWFIEKVIDIFSGKLYSFSKNDEFIVRRAHDIVLKLLGHLDVGIQRKVYELCHKKVMDNIGTKINLSSPKESGTQIFFLFHSDILTEIAVFGLNNEKVKQYAEDILMYILKSKQIMSKNLWMQCLEVLVPALPFLLCYANNNSALGRLIINLVDPDTSRSLLLPDIVMLKCNIQLLYSRDSQLRDEAFSRLCWLMASQENSREFLPKLNTIYDKALSNIFSIKNITDINKIGKTEHFYQPSSLNQVLEVLKSPNVEPVIRRSALNQVSVMMEDHLLHEIFLKSDGITIILDIMKTCLMERDFRDYPDSIIPIISILKSISLYHSSVRHSLSTNIDVLYYTLRGIFLFFTDDRIRQDGAMLLFLLIFQKFINGSPSMANFAIPIIFSKHLLLPVKCIFYMSSSTHLGEDIYSAIVKDKWSLSSIQLQWNIEKLGGIQNLINVESVELLNSNDIYTANDAEILKLTDFNLNNIKLSSIHYCVKKYLNVIQNATSHNAIIETVPILVSYLNFFVNISNLNNDSGYGELLAHPWEKTFVRFLEILPSSKEDINLLSSVFKVLICLVPFYKNEGNCWISDFIKNPQHCLLDLLIYDCNKDEEVKNLSQEFLNLITLCVLREHRYLDHYNVSVCKKHTNIGWNPLIKIITDNLVLNNTQHFYNLAYLDALLSCLVHLTASLGWTNCIPDSTPEKPIPQLISSLCELLTAFHCGKGPTAAISVMGLSISRNILLVLNHILGEIQHSKNKKWENCFFDDLNFTRSILALWTSRDVVLRAAAVQLFTNLAISPKSVKNIINDLQFHSGNIWDLAFSVLIDYSEASIVRENAALLLTNVTKNLFFIGDNKLSPRLNITSNDTEDQNPKEDILSLVHEYDFYNHVDIIFSSFFSLSNYSQAKSEVRIPDPCSSKHSDSTNSKSNETCINITTPGFINAFCGFLYNLVELDPDSICFNLQERRLIIPIFRTLCKPMMSADDNRSLDFYCNILEMDTNVCSILKKISCLNIDCLRTILHSECLIVMLELLNSKLYHTHLPELMYLRNMLWTEIFNLCTVLLEQLSEENGINIKSVESANTIIECIMAIDVEAFFDCLCESLSCLEFNDLQQAALQFFLSLLRIESYSFFESSNPKSKYSLKIILNTVTIPRKVTMSFINDNIENVPPTRRSTDLEKNSSQQFEKYKRNILEEVYFGKFIESPKNEYKGEEIEVSLVSSDGHTLLAGSELCKILFFLFEIASIKTDKNQQWAKKKSTVTLALASIVGLSEEAKNFALRNGLMEVLIKELRNYHINLSLESAENIRNIQDKKRLCPVLKNLDELIGLLTNFMIDCKQVKLVAINLSMVDIIHKLWIWFLIQKIYIVNVLRLLSVYTKDCKEACRSLSLTSAVPGSGPTKTPSNTSLLHAIIAVINKEMDQISKTHNLINLSLAFDVLQNCTNLLECRVLLSKSSLFLAVTKLHPAVTKRQSPWDKVELLWLTFMHSFTRYPEGQALVAKVDILEIIISLTSSNKLINREMALLVLRNIAFYQPNRARLLSSGEFLNILQTKIMTGTIKEKKTTVLTIWTLAANNQKAKLIFKSAKIDTKLENILKQSKLLGVTDGAFESEMLNMVQIVLDILRGTNKIR